MVANKRHVGKERRADNPAFGKRSFIRIIDGGIPSSLGIELVKSLQNDLCTADLIKMIVNESYFQLLPPQYFWTHLSRYGHI